jgi:peptide/nickel transport system substrate-binding protein
VLLLLLATTARCTRSGPVTSSGSDTTLRVGFPEAGSQNELEGIRQVRQILSAEGLARIGEDGRPTAALAEGWTTAADGLSMKIRLRPGIRFHDGSPVDAPSVVKALAQILPRFMGPAYADVDHITSAGAADIEITFRRPAPFLLEALDAPVREPGSSSVGTGPYMSGDSSAANEMRSNPNYYRGRPAIDRIVVTTYPNVRSAWAEMLRERVDMLWEVGVDALDSLATAKNVSTFTYVRHYQYVLIFNTNAGPLRSREVRRALNQAVDQDVLIREAFDGHAKASTGPVWPQHWAFRADLPRFSFDPGGAAAGLRSGRGGKDTLPAVRFKCLIRPPVERIALGLKRQLEAVGAEMSVEELPLDAILQAMAKREFDAVLLETISGPSLLRPYQVWHSGGFFNPGGIGSPKVDAALDLIRYATSDNEYRNAVENLQKTIVDDPPGIFLAWSERARAVSNRFHVPSEPGRDILTTIRLWRPVETASHLWD